MRHHDDEPRMRRRAAVGAALLTAGALVVAACSGGGEVATGADAGGGEPAPVEADNATDAAALASAIGGIETSTTAPATGVNASGAENCKALQYHEDAQATLNAGASDPYHLDEDGNGVACDGLPRKPVASLPPPTTAPPTTAAPTTTAAPRPPVTTVPPAQAAAQPQPITPTADEQKVVNFVNTKIGKMLTPEATLFNAARSGSTTPPGPVSYTFWANASATGGGSIDGLLPSLGNFLGQFGQCTHVGVGLLSDPAGQKILVLCGKF